MQTILPAQLPQVISNRSLVTPAGCTDRRPAETKEAEMQINLGSTHPSPLNQPTKGWPMRLKAQMHFLSLRLLNIVRKLNPIPGHRGADLASTRARRFPSRHLMSSHGPFSYREWVVCAKLSATFISHMHC